MEQPNNITTTTTNTPKLYENFRFVNGILIPQKIKKSDLAAFYGKSMKNFIRELIIANIDLRQISKFRHYYNVLDCKLIFENIGFVYESDMKTYRNTIELEKKRRKKLKKQK